MMWFLEDAPQGYQHLDQGGSFLANLAIPFKQAIKQYRRDANPFLQWIDEEIAIEKGKDIEAHDAYHAFMAYIHEQNPKFTMPKREFR